MSDADFDEFLSLSPKSRLSAVNGLMKKSHLITDSSHCYIQNCNKSLGIVNGRQNCSKCGKETCNLHSRFQMKLNFNAKHDPVNGCWSRVCQNCYFNRDGYKNNHGVSRNKTSSFLKIRKQIVTTTSLEVNKIEKRLEKLEKSVKEFQSSPLLTRRTSFLKNPIEPVAPWVEDHTSNTCHLCENVFGLLVRKHHCRLCGQLICFECSRSVPIADTIDHGIRSCKKCVFLLSLRKKSIEQQSIPTIVTLYQSYKRYVTNITTSLNTFNSLLIELNGMNDIDPKSQTFQLALKLRKECLDTFSQIDKISKSIKSLPTTSSYGQRIQDNVYISIINYLQQHMFTMQKMPTIQTTKVEQVIPILDDRVLVLQDSIKQMNDLLNDMIGKRKFEDAEIIRGHLMELQSELDILLQSI
ncbi:hypothetical protein BC833DRAFT_589769, partial [Globomyces pollinis-pini]